jgi:uncharacterized protein YbjT (DUF2867 family)
MRAAGSKAAFFEVDYTYTLRFAELGLQAGAQQMHLLTAMGANAHSLVFYNRVKGQVETAVAKLGYPTLCIYQPSLLLGPRQESRPAEKLAQALLGPVRSIFGGPLAAYKPIEAVEVARAIAVHLLAPAPGVHRFPNDALLAAASSYHPV